MTGIVILAAGQSSRMGTPKQNLVYNHQTLLQHTLTVAIVSGCKPVIVVLGANSDAILPGVKDNEVSIVHNPSWQQGMSTSIRAGINELQKTPAITGVIILLCDQPFIDATLIKQILQKHTETNKGIVACTYNNTQGVPVLFNQRYFVDLLKLQGHEGAKKLLSAYMDDIAEVNFPKGNIDIDTMEDYNRLADM